jgi:hypothetical protein
MKKLQYITLRLFLVMMVLCAGSFLNMIWRTGGPDNFDVINQLAITFFVIGLASFLVWIVTIILDIKNNIEKR